MGHRVKALLILAVGWGSASLVQSPATAAAQEGYTGAHVLAVVARGSEVTVGYSVFAETAIAGGTRLGLSRTAFNALIGCSVHDAVSECEKAPISWELTVSQGFGSSARTAPFVTAGVGLLRTTWASTRDPSAISFFRVPERVSSPVVSLSLGMDVRLTTSLTLRVVASRREVLDGEVQDYYRFFAGRRLSFSGFAAGLGVATW